MPRLSLDDITIAYDDVGAGPDVLLLVHGHPFNRSMWKPQLAALADSSWRIIAPDLRGYGESTVVPGRATLDVFAADLATLLDRLGVERVVLGGLSMGGQIVMEFCRQHPARVRGVVLAATSPVAESEEGKCARHAMADRLLREGMGGYADEVLAKMLAPANIAAFPAAAAHVRGMMRGTDPRGAAAALRGRADRPSYEPTLAALQAPALICVGDADAFTTRADAELMRRLVKRSQLLWLPGVGHMPNLERSAEFDAALRGFLAAVPA
ncbi:MAG TPA: alpha/beta hydrolase [Gemmatimonadaceae bacterium]